VPASPTSAGLPEGWALVVPVKPAARAKTRLAAYGDTARAELALAFAADVVAAALACEAVRCVVVVTDDVRVAGELAGPRVRVLPDRPGEGLNAAVDAGAARVRQEVPGGGVAALVSDLPALRPAELDAALRAVAGRAFVPDAAGVGTTLLAAGPGQALLPSYGPRSRALHLASGAVELPGLPGLRRDVDTPSDLRSALALGVGPRTAAVVAGLARLDAG
jgi:2-phospho-L-lactate guanylyltransferase